MDSPNQDLKNLKGKGNFSLQGFQKASLFLIILIFFFLLHRLSIILFGYSHISHPGFDETVSGVLACDLLEGQIRGPLFVYEYLNRSGDLLLEGFFLVPFFKFLGRTLFSTKLFALSSAFITMFCWILFLKRYQGIWAAIIFTALFVFPPPMFARLNLLGTIDSHHLINPIIAIQLLILFWIIEENKRRAILWLWFGLGFFTGLGIYTFYTYIIFAGFSIIFLLIFRFPVIKFRHLVLGALGFALGFLPWIIRAGYTKTGGLYLTSLLKNLNLDLWSFVQVFGFNFPHSLGYAYPSREIGIVSIIAVLAILFFSGVLIIRFFQSLFLLSGKLRYRIEKIEPATLQGLFVGTFPAFFLGCLSLSPMRIYPFEYWPTIGLFATFPPADALRYRWLHVLFPFYLAIVALGSIIFFAEHNKSRFVYRLLTISALTFFLFFGITNNLKFYSKADFAKIFSYKGYNYDQFAPKFILGELASHDFEHAKTLTLNYPLENKGEAYRCLGTLLTEDLNHASEIAEKLEASLEEVPQDYRKDFIYGIVRGAQILTQEGFEPIKEVVVKKYPELFYENWGFRFLGYKYYGILVNYQLLLHHIPKGEQWFFKEYLENFRRKLEFKGKEEKECLKEISLIPEEYQKETLIGIGKLVGAEMLFDPLFQPDYPLDSSFGERFRGSLRDAFYEGVGRGFAETFCRFLRMLQLPEDPESPQYQKRVNLEWERVQDLSSRMKPEILPLIRRGFSEELESSPLAPGIKNYLRDLKSSKN